MKTKILKALSLFFAILFFTYAVVIRILTPVIISFSDIWFLLSLFFIYFFIRLKKGKFLSKKGRIILLSFAGIAFAVSAVNLFFIFTPQVNDGSVSTKYLLVLGGGIRRDGSLSEMPMERLRSASLYLKNHPETKAIVSGGTLPLSEYAEAPAMKKELQLMGIEEERILMEDEALNTIENFQKSLLVICREENISKAEALSMPLTVVTSSFHLARSERLAKRLGFTEVYGLPAKVPAIYALNVYAREILSYVKLNLEILFTGKPERII